MANFKIPETPEYNNEMRMLETSDRAHADVFNAPYGQLLENCEYLKQQFDNLLEEETVKMAQEAGFLSGGG